MFIMADEIEQLKTVFRSLVVSSPTQVNVCSLLRDYRSMIGAPVPLTKYGYRNPVEFLKERFSDCFLFSGAPSNPVLTLIVPNSLKHIDKFVQKQKVSSTAKFNPKRRSVPEECVKPLKEKFNNFVIKNNLRSETPKKSCETLNLSNSRVVVSKPTPAPSKVNHNGVADRPIVYNNLVDNTNTVSKPQNISNVEDKNNDVHGTTKNSPHTESKDDKIDNAIADNCNAVKIFLRKRLPLYNSSNYLDEESNSPEPPDGSIHDDDSGRHTASSGNSGKAQQLEQLKHEVMQLICDAPDGVWCTDLIRLYRDRYNRELNFTRFGFTSIISLVYSVEQRVQITRPDATGDWLLQERARATPAPPALRARRPRTARPVSDSLRALDPDDALPGIDFDPDVFPEDCMHFMESIESVSLNDFRPGAMVEVMIGEVYSPSHFWFIRVGDNYNIAMEEMMDEMTHYYNNVGRERVLSRGAVRVGHYCSSLYERDWHRSLIVKVLDSDTVKVRHVDYGTVDTVSVSSLKPLRRAWAQLPAQAARARLAAVRPPAAGWRWPHAACTAFLALVTNRRLVANVVALDQRDQIAEVLLIDTSSEEDVCIGTELIRAGHADSRPDSALRVSANNDYEESNSDISASASEVMGRAPRRLRTWDADSQLTTVPMDARSRLYRVAALTERITKSRTATLVNLPLTQPTLIHTTSERDPSPTSQSSSARVPAPSGDTDDETDTVITNNVLRLRVALNKKYRQTY